MQTYNIVLVQPPGYGHAMAFQEVGKLLLYSFQTLGLPCTFRINAFDPSALNIVLGYQLLPDASVFEACRCIPYQLEPVPEHDPWVNPQQPLLLQKALEVWDYSAENMAVLQARGTTEIEIPPI